MSQEFVSISRGILDSSIAEDWLTRFVFQDLLLLADKSGVVDMTASAISRRTHAPLGVVRKALETLEAPDPESRSLAEDGRRLVRLDPDRSWGWRIVNFERYQVAEKQARKRATDRYRMRRKRAVGDDARQKATTRDTTANKGLTDSGDDARQKATTRDTTANKRLNPRRASSGGVTGTPLSPPTGEEREGCSPYRSG